LSKIFDIVDIEEPSQRFFVGLAKLKDTIKNIRNIYTAPGQDFVFESNYDLIFGVGLLGYIPDLDVVKFLIEARKHLNPNGKLIFKEAIWRTDASPFGDWWGMKVRKLDVYKLLFKLTGYKLIYHHIIIDWRGTKTFDPWCTFDQFVLEVDNK